MIRAELKTSIDVYADWQECQGPKLMGTLHSQRSKGKEIFSFEYHDSWLKEGSAQVLDPDLNLYQGQHYLTEDKGNFGLFLDSSPDRWGRILMRRREAALARLENRQAKPTL